MNHEKIYTQRIELKLTKNQKLKVEKLVRKLNYTINQLFREIVDGRMCPDVFNQIDRIVK